MTVRNISTGFAIVCLVFVCHLFSGKYFSTTKNSVPKTAVKIPAVKPVIPVTTPPVQMGLNAAIEKIFVKNNRVFVILNGTGGGIAP